MNNNFICEKCGDRNRTILYDMWIRSAESKNLFAKGTATAGLLTHARICYKCTQRMDEMGLLNEEASKQSKSIEPDPDYEGNVYI